MSRSAGSNLGIMLPINQRLPQQDLVDLAVYAEQSGLDAIGIGEYASADAFALASAIAVRTERIRIETCVVSVITRSPALLSMGAATVDDLSGGRFVLGLGAGSPVVAGFHDRSFDRPLAAVEETITDVRALLNGERLAEQRFELRMPRPGRVPIMLSALNPGMIRLAATRTDGVMLPLLCSPRLVGELVRVIDGLRREHGSEGDFEAIAIQHGSATNEENARNRVKREIGGYFLVPTYRRAALDLVGEAELDRAAEAHAVGGMDAVVEWLPDSAVNEVFVGGDANAISARIQRLEQSGSNGVRFTPVTVTSGDLSAARRLIDVIAEVRAARES